MLETVVVTVKCSAGSFGGEGMFSWLDLINISSIDRKRVLSRVSEKCHGFAFF
jgi:hypothetical protein